MHATPAPYNERLRAPWSWWLAALAVAVLVWWIFFVATPPWVAVVAALVAAVLLAWGLAAYGAAEVVLDDAGVRAGRAFLPWQYVGPSVALDPEQTRNQLGA